MKQTPTPDRWLKAQRARHHLTQAQLAQATDLTLRDIQRMEKGELTLQYHKYLLVAEYFGATLNDMLFGEVEE